MSKDMTGLHVGLYLQTSCVKSKGVLQWLGSSSVEEPLRSEMFWPKKRIVPLWYRALSPPVRNILATKKHPYRSAHFRSQSEIFWQNKGTAVPLW